MKGLIGGWCACKSVRSCCVWVLLVMAVNGSPVGATTLVEQSFDDLVAQSEQIFIGIVDRVEAKMTADKKAIYTYVTFTVIEPIEGIGPLQNSYTMRFSGGHVGDYHSLYLGMPEFEVGQKVLLFTHMNEKAMCPVVGWTQGCFHVAENGSQESVMDYSRNSIVGVDFSGNLQRADNSTAGGGGVNGSPGVDADGGDAGEVVANSFNAQAVLSVADFVEEIHATRDWTGFKPDLTANSANQNQWIRVPSDASQAQQLFGNLSPPQPSPSQQNAWIPRPGAIENPVKDEPLGVQSPSVGSTAGGKSK